MACERSEFFSKGGQLSAVHVAEGARGEGILLEDEVLLETLKTSVAALFKRCHEWC